MIALPPILESVELSAPPAGLAKRPAALAFFSLARSVATALVQLLIVSVLIFGVLRVLPVDPTAMMLPPTATNEDAAKLRESLGLDRPVAEQYLIWLNHAVRLDLGESSHFQTPVAKLIGEALPITIELAVCGMLLGIAVGFALGLATFYWSGGAFARWADALMSLAQAVPEFLWGILLILVFGLYLQWLPFIGPIDLNMQVPSRTGFLLVDTLLAGRLDAFGNRLSHLLLPAVAVALIKAPLVMRVLRSSLLETYSEEYIDAARLRGLSERRILFGHALRNASLPTVTLVGTQAAQAFGGTLLIEVIYGQPGLGNLMIEAIRTLDLPLIQGIALVYCAVVLAVNRIVDALYLRLNPRLRVQS